MKIAVKSLDSHKGESAMVERLSFLSLFVCLFFPLFSSESNGNQTQPFTDRDVFELEWVSDPQISPDASRIAYLRNSFSIMSDNKISRIWLTDKNGNNNHKLSHYDGMESSPRWSHKGDKIAFIRSTKQGSEIFLYWINTASITRLTQLERSPSGLSWSPDDKYLAFSMLVPEKPVELVKAPQKPKGAKWAEPPRVTTRLIHEADGKGYIEPGFNHFFILPAEGGTARQITRGSFHHKTTPQWTPDGKALVYSANRTENWEYEHNNTEIYKTDIQSRKTLPLTDRQGPDLQPVVSPNGKHIAYLGYKDKIQAYQSLKIHLMNADGGQKRTLNTGLDRSFSNLTWDHKSRGLYFQYDDKGETKIGYISTDTSSAKGKAKVVARRLGGTLVGRPYPSGSYSVSTHGDIAYTYTKSTRPAELAIVPRGKKKAELITQLNSDLLAYRQLPEAEEIWYRSSIDQRQIQGWIIKPPQFDPKKSYPLLVENHGGPFLNYGKRFSAEMQLYAAAGYLVFYPNPRGSTGYGEQFSNLLYNNYPGDDYQDVMDGVDTLLERPYVDRENLFVTGGSAGGIMTAWIIGKNNRFKAAAVIKPVMNWFSKTLTADNYYGYANYRYPGQPWENITTYMNFSPISLVGNVQTPTLVMVGTEDLRTPLSEAKQLYHALKLRKIDTALVEIPKASHAIAKRPSQLIAKVNHILAWFNQYHTKRKHQ